MRVMASSFLRFLDHTQRRITVGRTPLDEWSARRRDLTDSTQHSQQTNILVSGGIRTHNLSRQAAADLRLRSRGHRDWLRHVERILCWQLIAFKWQKKVGLYSDLWNRSSPPSVGDSPDWRVCTLSLPDGTVLQECVYQAGDFSVVDEWRVRVPYCKAQTFIAL